MMKIIRKEFQNTFCIFTPSKESSLFRQLFFLLTDFKLLLDYFFIIQMSLLKFLDPVNYITNSQELQAFCCSICFQFRLEMRKCTEPCRKYVCALCIINYKLSEYSFCNQNFKFQNADIPQTNFRCPSNSEECQAQLRSAKEFLRHSSKCVFIQQELRKQFGYKINYKCQCGYSLQFNGKSKCFQCKLQFGARNKCPKCWLYFCTMCRIPPCTKQKCMNGHLLRKGQKNYVTCDLCRIEIKKLNQEKIFSDRLCNFDVCVYCYQKLKHNNPYNFICG